MSKKYPFKRDFYEDVVKSIKRNRATFVLGPRKCGKTVCLKQIADSLENAEYINLKDMDNDKDVLDVFLKIEKSIKNDEDKIYLIDEITYSSNPEVDICMLADLFSEYDTKNIKVVFSGSQSLALERWGHIAFCGSAGFIRTDFLSYSEWLKYKQIKTPSAENYERFLYESVEFYELDSMWDYLQGCLDETIISNDRARSYLYGNDCELLNADILLEVCYATLFTLHKYVSGHTFMKDDYLKRDVRSYIKEICKEIDLDERIQDSFVSKYSKLQIRKLDVLEQAFMFLKNCGLITITPIVKDLEEIPDIDEDLRLIAHGREPRTDFKEGLFKKFNMCIKYPAFYVAILKDILKEQMPDHLPNEILGSIVECHIRGMLPEDFAAEYHDTKEREIDYVNIADKNAVEITISNKPLQTTHFDLLPEDYRKILLTKDISDTFQGVRRIPYYEFLYGGVDFNAYTKESVLQSTKRYSESDSSDEQDVFSILNSDDGSEFEEQSGEEGSEIELDE